MPADEERPVGETLAVAELVAWVDRFDELCGSNVGWLTELDSAIGDADHGVNLTRGTATLRRSLHQDAPVDAGELLQRCGMILLATVGGASGALLGSMFRAMGERVGAETALSAGDLAAAFEAGLASVVALGRAEVGDKTMVDALAPGVAALVAGAGAGASRTADAGHGLPLEQILRGAARAAVAGRESTRPLAARKGRASYLGARSADHLDPGAASASLLFEALTLHTTLTHHHTTALTGAPMSTIRRQFVNRPDDVIAEALEGLQLTHPALLAFDAEANVISRAVPASGKVGLVSGGGSGHEPLHAGFVGTGMLDAAVCGAVFASPTSEQVQAGTRLADSGAGVVHIVKNYTGDVLNFEIAAELVSDDGIAMEAVIVDDDLASDGAGDGPGRRGTAAVVTVEKVLGALAEQGADLATVAAAGRDVVARSRSLALALDACTHPGESRAAFELAADEVEFGVGIHGERGTSRIPFATADELVEQLVTPLADSLELRRGQSVIAIVNGLGGAYPLELSIMARQVHRLLEGRGVGVARSLVGSYVTSLDMHGASVTFTVADDELVRLWDAPVRTPNLTW
ncbi:dihydroxyacetone kinase subunit DhaL [Herbiconiux sp. A18JL235]|uniref:Dihydroxyacetone kinase subunit DhaL n=1 Tax=Herbiconiux sp. A18JL235 TaxID=3152363 RepID=A0AB39BEP9_9MICO